MEFGEWVEDRWFLSDFSWARSLGQYDCVEQRFGVATGRRGSPIAGVTAWASYRCNKCFGCFSLAAVKQRSRLQAGFRQLPRFAEDHDWPHQELMRRDWREYLWQTGRFLTLTWNPEVPYAVSTAHGVFKAAIASLKEGYPGLQVYTKYEHQGVAACFRLHAHCLLLNVPVDALVWQGARGATRDLSLKEWLRLDRSSASAKYKWLFLKRRGLGITESSRLRIEGWDRLVTYLCKEMYHGYDQELSPEELEAIYAVPPSWRRINRYNPGALWRMSAERVYEDGAHSVVPLWKVDWKSDPVGLPAIREVLKELVPGYTAQLAMIDLEAVGEGGAVAIALLMSFLERWAEVNRERSRFTAYRRQLLARLVGEWDADQRVEQELGPWAEKLFQQGKLVTAEWRRTGLEPWLRRQVKLLRLAMVEGGDG